MRETRETLWPIYFDAGGGRWRPFDEPVGVTARAAHSVVGKLAGLIVSGPASDFFWTYNEAEAECIRRNCQPAPEPPKPPTDEPGWYAVRPTDEEHYEACREDLERWLSALFTGGANPGREENCARFTAGAIERTILARLTILGVWPRDEDA